MMYNKDTKLALDTIANVWHEFAAEKVADCIQQGKWSRGINSEVALATDNLRPNANYQYNLIKGWEALSGSTIKGRAVKWGACYARSRDSALSKIGTYTEIKGAHGKRILVVGTTAVTLVRIGFDLT
jgi:hypothetical protein